MCFVDLLKPYAQTNMEVYIMLTSLSISPWRIYSTSICRQLPWLIPTCGYFSKRLNRNCWQDGFREDLPLTFQNFTRTKRSRISPELSEILALRLQRKYSKLTEI